MNQPITTPQLVTTFFAKHGITVKEVGQPFEYEEDGRTITAHNFEVEGKPFGILTGPRVDDLVQMALFHESQIDESDPSPLLETWWPRVIVHSLQHSTTLCELLGV